MSKTITGRVFVLDDNIDTDQIIPAEYLTLVPSKPDEYEKLGSYAMIGLPDRYDRLLPMVKIRLSMRLLWLAKILVAVLP